MSKLHDGTLEEEAARLTKASGHFQRTLAATFFSSLTLVPMNMSNVVRLAEKRTDTQIVARHDCWVSLNRPQEAVFGEGSIPLNTHEQGQNWSGFDVFKSPWKKFSAIEDVTNFKPIGGHQTPVLRLPNAKP